MKRKRPIKVLMVSPRLEVCGGVESYIMSYYKNIDRNHVSIDFAAHRADEPSYKEYIEQTGGKVFIIPEKELKNPFGMMKRLDAFFKEHGDYDVVHCNMPNGGFYYLRAAKKAGVPVRILHAHQTKYADVWLHAVRNYPLIKLGKFYANERCACSEAAGKFLFGKNYHVIKNALPSERFFFNEEDRVRRRREMGLDGKLVVCNVGRFCNQKNQLFLLDIFKSLLTKRPDAVLLLVGDGEQRADVEEKIGRLGIKDSVILAGVQKDIPAYLMVSDVMAMPSLYEGLPIVGLEAQASGLPCVIADTVTPELNITGNVTFCSLRADTETWADVILENASRERMPQEEILQRMRGSGYDIHTEARKLEQLYEKMLSADGDSY
jgi:Glycosyltransferase